MRQWRSATGRIVQILCLVLTGCATGCATAPYQAGCRSLYYTSPELAERTVPQFERGQPRPILDWVGWVVGIPDKIILWDRRVANHHISSETEAAIDEYLMVNELDSVKVRLNQYSPLDDWQRLRANQAVGCGWRYTLGTLSWLGETVIPGRVFGDDHFNPFTNTIHLYSDAPAIGLHEAGHAKDFAQRRYKGTYAALYLLPGMPLWHEALATNDALRYLEARGDVEARAEAYRLLYPAYGTYAGDAAAHLAPDYGALIYAGGVVTGHALGRLRARQIEAESESTVEIRRLPAVDDER